MRFLAMALLLLMAFFPAGAANAITGEDILNSFNEVGDDNAITPLNDRLAGLKALKTGRNHGQGSSEVHVSVFYPEGTGNREVDRALKNYADKAVAEFNKQAEEARANGLKQPATLARSFAAFKPGDDYLTVVFNRFIDTGGAHPDWGYEAVTFDLKSGREVTAESIFPNESGFGFMANYINAALDEKCLQNPVADRVCGPAEVNGQGARDNLDKLIFTPEGIVVLYSPYDQGSYAEGAKYVEIPKEKLLNWGASDVFWD